MPDFGKYRHRIKLKRATFTQNSFNELIPTMATVAERWARVKQVQGAELVQGEQVQSQTIYEVAIRYEAALAITEMDVIEHQGVDLNIDSKVVNEVKSEMLLVCKAGP